MTTTELLDLAATVIWPSKTSTRPMGELLASGEIQPHDLNWAVQKAYNPAVKWAAAVQLKAAALQEVALSPAAAREVVWPFKEINRPIGELLDAHTIDLHDLAYAVAHAYEPAVRDAAAVLGGAIVQRQLEPGALQPTVSPHPAAEAHTPVIPPTMPAATPTASALEVIEGSSYLSQQIQKKQRWISVLALIILYALLIALLISVGSIIANFVLEKPVSIGWSVVTMLFLGGTMLFAPKLEQVWKEYKNYSKGQKGERRIITGLRRVLKAPWVLFHNVILPGGQDDIDLVLVGPNGIYALEVKSFTGYYRNTGDRWQKRYLLSWCNLSRNPSRQVLRNAQRLHDYLESCGVTVWVEPRVVWASESKLWLRRPAVPVWQVAKASFIGADLAEGKPLDEATRLQIVALLKANNLSYVQKERKGKAKQ